jgi:hypothetical protein
VKLLVAISSCYDFEKNGSNQTMRDCWLRDCAAVGLDYKFFVGTGQGAENAVLDSDTVLLGEVDDGYGDLSRKSQHSLRWANERDYTHVFRCFPDTYCRPERLIGSGFHGYDYYGDFRGEHCTPDNYPSGGPGYWMSRKAYILLLDAPITGSEAMGKHTKVWPYAEDLWAGQVLNWHRDLNLRYFDDDRFVNRGTNHDGPLATNNIISCHLSCPDRYHPGRMKEKHEAWLNSVRALEAQKMNTLPTCVT